MEDKKDRKWPYIATAMGYIFSFNTIFNRNNNVHDTLAFVKENEILLNNLIIYFNENTKKIGKIYKCVYPGISSEYVYQNNIMTWKKLIAENAARRENAALAVPV